MVSCIPNCLACLFSILKPCVMALLLNMIRYCKWLPSECNHPLSLPHCNCVPNVNVLMPYDNALALLKRDISQIVKPLISFNNSRISSPTSVWCRWTTSWLRKKVSFALQSSFTYRLGSKQLSSGLYLSPNSSQKSLYQCLLLTRTAKAFWLRLDFTSSLIENLEETELLCWFYSRDVTYISVCWKK